MATSKRGTSAQGGTNAKDGARAQDGTTAQGKTRARGKTSAQGNASANTGTQDVTYNLVSILYHALQGAETYDQYIRDAEQGGDRELADFFREVQEENAQRADRAKQLLGQRLTQR